MSPVRLAGGGGGLWGQDGRALLDKDVDGGFDAVVLCARLRGGGSCRRRGVQDVVGARSWRRGRFCCCFCRPCCGCWR